MTGGSVSQSLMGTTGSMAKATRGLMEAKVSVTKSYATHKQLKRTLTLFEQYNTCATFRSKLLV